MNETLQLEDKTSRAIAYLLSLDDKWRNKMNSCEYFSALRTRAYVTLYAAFHNTHQYDLNRIHQSISFSRWLMEIYANILNEQLVYQKNVLQEKTKSKSIDINEVCNLLTELINKLKGVN